VGAVIAEIPCLVQIDIDQILDDAVLLVDADKCRVEVVASG